MRIHALVLHRVKPSSCALEPLSACMVILELVYMKQLRENIGQIQHVHCVPRSMVLKLRISLSDHRYAVKQQTALCSVM